MHKTGLPVDMWLRLTQSFNVKVMVARDAGHKVLTSRELTLKPHANAEGLF
jgi:hypothetical protein